MDNHFGNQIIILDEIDSTNDYALRLLSKERPITGTVIVADFQTLGRGQVGTKWHGERGANLYCSTIIYPKNLHPSKGYLLSTLVANAIQETVSTILGIPSKIKWPNDVLVNGKKIAGILIQTGLQSESFDYAVIGIGINVLQSNFDLELKKATSIKLESNLNITPLLVLEVLLDKLNKQYSFLQKGEFENLLEQYHEHLFLKGENVIFLDHVFPNQGVSFEAKIIGLDPSGKLCLSLRNDTKRVVDLKEVTLLGKSNG
jgi:BirA family transcriptional regulator, biotin operon repressor / biotin---[acetyl-CoA-carboxylase] ligase